MCFRGTASRIGGVTFKELAKEVCQLYTNCTGIPISSVTVLYEHFIRTVILISSVTVLMNIVIVREHQFLQYLY